MKDAEQVRIITIDGPSGSGKGTVASRLSKRLGWHCLDSGALYRLLGLRVKKAGIGFEDEGKIAELAKTMGVKFVLGDILLNGEDVTQEIRTESAGNNASKVAALPAVREALLQWQREYARTPGLVADGRDMGSVVFPAAGVKIFLDASAEERARRRYKQLKEKGLDVNLRTLIAEIQERDQRDRNRGTAPLKAADDALVIESTRLTVDEVLEIVLDRVRSTFRDIDV